MVHKSLLVTKFMSTYCLEEVISRYAIFMLFSMVFAVVWNCIIASCGSDFDFYVLGDLLFDIQLQRDIGHCYFYNTQESRNFYLELRHAIFCTILPFRPLVLLILIWVGDARCRNVVKYLHG